MLTCAHSSTIHNSQDMETISASTDRWMGKEDMVHRYNGILLSDKKEWNNAICSNMDGSRDVILSEVSQKKNDTYHTYVWTITYDINELT